jgi:hypothetical protein
MRRGVRLVLAALVVLGVVVSLAACGVKESSLPTNNLDVARDAAAKVNLLAVQTGIQSYIVANSQLPPSAAQSVIGGTVDRWPTNPFTNAPMAEGTAPGDYTYTPGSGTSFTLVVHLSDGGTAAAP